MQRKHYRKIHQEKGQAVTGRRGQRTSFPLFSSFYLLFPSSHAFSISSQATHSLLLLPPRLSLYLSFITFVPSSSLSFLPSFDLYNSIFFSFTATLRPNIILHPLSFLFYHPLTSSLSSVCLVMFLCLSASWFLLLNPFLPLRFYLFFPNYY